ncbi:MAG: hypothetical protein NVSMB62_12910 [Acidobacteriaceae bacterium]
MPSIDLLHSHVVSTAKPFAIFLLRPARYGVRVAVLVAVVDVGPAMVGEVALRALQAIVKAALLHGLLCIGAIVLEGWAAIVLLRKGAACAGEQCNSNRGYK